MVGESSVRQKGRVAIFGHPLDSDQVLRLAFSSDEKEIHRIQPRVQINACAMWEDVYFDFGKAFIKKSIKPSLENFRTLCEDDYPDCPITIFGHADPVGNIPFNHDLSERRARALYAMIVRDVSAWCEIFKTEVGYLQRQLRSEGVDPGPADGIMGPQTRGAIQTYMDNVADRLKLTPGRFLGQGKFAFQGCSEFNPVRVFSKAEDSFYRQQSNWHKRNSENQPNRRVIAFLLPEGFKGTDSSWICRTGTKGLAICRKMTNSSWSKARAQLTDSPRRHSAGDKTFTCSIYYDLADISPCERTLFLALIAIPIQQKWSVEITGYETMFDTQLQKWVEGGFFSRGHYEYVQDTVDILFRIVIEFMVFKTQASDPWQYKEGQILSFDLEILNNINPKNDPGRSFMANEIKDIVLTDKNCAKRLEGCAVPGEIVSETDVWRLYNQSDDYPDKSIPKTTDLQFRRITRLADTAYCLVQGQSVGDLDKVCHVRLSLPDFSIPLEIRFKVGIPITIKERIELTRWADDLESQWIPLKEGTRQFEHVRVELLSTPLYTEPYMIVNYKHRVIGPY